MLSRKCFYLITLFSKINYPPPPQKKNTSTFFFQQPRFFFCFFVFVLFCFVCLFVVVVVVFFGGWVLTERLPSFFLYYILVCHRKARGVQYIPVTSIATISRCMHGSIILQPMPTIIIYHKLTILTNFESW